MCLLLHRFAVSLHTHNSSKGMNRLRPLISAEFLILISVVSIFFFCFYLFIFFSQRDSRHISISVTVSAMCRILFLFYFKFWDHEHDRRRVSPGFLHSACCQLITVGEVRPHRARPTSPNKGSHFLNSRPASIECHWLNSTQVKKIKESVNGWTTIVWTWLKSVQSSQWKAGQRKARRGEAVSEREEKRRSSKKTRQHSGEIITLLH